MSALRALVVAVLVQAACSAPNAAGQGGASGGSSAGESGVAGAAGGASPGGAFAASAASGGMPPAAGSSGVAAGPAGGSLGAAAELAQFATIREIVTYKCGGAGCHAGEMAPRLVDDDQLYGTLRNFVAKRCGNRPLVEPGSPEGSAFFLAQRGECGSQLPLMPLGCVDNCTPPEYLEAVRSWIAVGAPAQ